MSIYNRNFNFTESFIYFHVNALSSQKVLFKLLGITTILILQYQSKILLILTLLFYFFLIFTKHSFLMQYCLLYISTWARGTLKNVLDKHGLSVVNILLWKCCKKFFILDLFLIYHMVEHSNISHMDNQYNDTIILLSYE